jgi:hypothetical protein
MKPSRNLMVDNRDAVSGYKIERKRGHREAQITTIIVREFLFSSCQEQKAINRTPETQVRRQCEKMLNC